MLLQSTFALEPAPPFRLDLTVWALRRRPHNEVDRWDGQTYRRALILNGEPVAVEVTQVAPPETPLLHILVTSAREMPHREAVSNLLRRLLGLDIDLTTFYQFAALDEQLAPLVSRFYGFKPPRYPTLFDALLNAIASQQVTLNLAIQMLNKLAQNYGVVASDLHALPQPGALAHQDPEALRQLGFSGQKARTIIELAQAHIEGRLSSDEITALDDEAAMSRLCQFRGIGSWTAEYVLLRGLGRLHIYPGNDSGARNSLQRWLGLALDYEAVDRTFARWRPYAGLIYLHLLESIQNKAVNMV
jgi:DNA-3-methyladenine glycosylase II